MSQHIRDDIVDRDGNIPPIRENRDFTWGKPKESDASEVMQFPNTMGIEAAPPSPRRVYRTAQIKPETRNALMDQFALAADEIIRLNALQLYAVQELRSVLAQLEAEEAERAKRKRRWWRIFQKR